MKQKNLFGITAGVLALMASSAWIPDAQAGMFTPPAGGAPSQATGGASRGSLFKPAPSRSTPQRATGGASRGSLFKPATNRTAPQGSTGGASRGSLFKPAANRSAPQRTAAGAARGSLFRPQGAPIQAASGASRAGSYPLNPSITDATGPAALLAVVPQTFYGTTVAERPTILVYAPASSAREAIFSLKDEAGQTVHTMILPISGAAGIMAVTLPKNAPALTVGKNYQWFFALVVDGMLSPSTPYVDGWIQRIQPSATVTAALQQANAFQQATALGAEGVWYDCVATLATWHSGQSNQDASMKDWADLLASVGLKEIATVPVVSVVD
jgi:hypothetical protein